MRTQLYGRPGTLAAIRRPETDAVLSVAPPLEDNEPTDYFYTYYQDFLSLDCYQSVFPQSVPLYFPEIREQAATLAYGERKIVLTQVSTSTNDQGTIKEVTPWSVPQPPQSNFQYPSRGEREKRQRVVLVKSTATRYQLEGVLSLTLTDLNTEHTLEACLPRTVTDDPFQFFMLPGVEAAWDAPVLQKALAGKKFVFVLDLFRRSKREVEIVLSNVFLPAK